MDYKRSPIFSLLALATALLTIGLIVFGAIVRVTDSGLGCGDSWPLCNGTVFPPLDNLTAWIEWLHRLFAALIGVMGLVTLAVAWRVHRANRLIFGSVGLAAFLFILQSGLGAIVVILELPPTMVALHLGTAMLLLGALLVAVVTDRYKSQTHYQRDHVTTLTYVTAALSLVIMLTGALVRGSGAMLACIDWPLCNGAIFPFNQGQLAMIHMIHRFAVLALGIALVLLVWQIFQTRNSMVVRRFSMLALMTYLIQAGVGAMFVFSSAGSGWGVAHVGLAAATWALLVVLSVIEYLNSRKKVSEQEKAAWKPQSEAISN